LLNDLGGVCFALGRYHEAQWAYAESLRLLQTRSSEKNVPDANEGMVRSALGVVYGRLGSYKEAAELLDGALLIFERTVGTRHSDFAIALNNLADVRRMQGRFGEAEILMRRALPIMEETLGPKDRRVIIARANLAWFCARLGRALEADALSGGAVVAMEGQVGPNHSLLAEVLYIRADILKRAKRKAEAKLAYDRAQRLMQTYRRETGFGLTTDLHELSRPPKRFATPAEITNGNEGWSK
jgi:tetratricopeptide (TPR) repeat protein